MKLKLLLVTLLITAFTWGQTTIFSENIGTPSGTTNIASYSLGVTPATFQNIASLTYSNGVQTNSADVRITSVSSGYTGASGGGNVYFTSTSGAYGFSIEGINAIGYTSLTLDYGYRKEAAGSFATFSVDYWDGSAWQTIANSSATLFNEASVASTGWYAAKTLSLPVGAQINGLKIRFVKTGTTAIRIDDIILKGSTLSCTPSVTTNATNQSIIENNNAVFSLVANNVISYQWQVSTDGTNYYNITNTGIYSGATTNTLTITGVPVTMSGYIYRCQLTPNTPCVAITSVPVTLTVNGTSCLTEGFSAGTSAPTNWTFTNIGTTYTSIGNYGSASPSLNMGSLGTTGNAIIETPTVANIQQLSFWMKGQGTTGGSSYLLVEGFNGSTWVQIDNISSIVSNTVYIKTYNSNTSPILSQNIQKVRFTYFKLPASSGGNISFDDVAFNCSTCSSSTTWNGSVWSNGTPNSSTTAVINANYATPGSIDACSILVNPGKTFTINASDYLKIQNNLIVNGNLNVNSSGSIVQVNNTTNTGIITCNRTVTGLNGYDYIYWSSPVFSTSSSGQLLDNIYISPVQGPKYKWNTTETNANSTQGAWDSASGDYMIPGKGYIVRSSSSYGSINNTVNAVFSGMPNNGDVTIPIYRGSLSGMNDNNNLVGNPYPSPISIVNFISNNTNIDGNVSLWKHSNSPTSTVSPFYQNFQYNYYNDYLTINGTGATNSSTTPYYIASGQGFFVSMSENPITDYASSSGTVKFTNSMRDKTYDNSIFYKTLEEKGRIWLDLLDSNNVPNRTLIGYVDNATSDIDRMYDAEISFGTTNMIYSTLNTKPFIIQGKSLPFDVNDQVPLGINIITTGNYKIAIGEVDGLFKNSQSIYLQDTLLGIIFDLRQTPYSFYSESGIFNNRFVLRYTNNSLTSDNFSSINNNVVVATPSTNQISVQSSLEKINSLVVYDMLGREIVYKNNVSENLIIVTNITSKNQVLFVKIKLENGQTITQKVRF